MDDDDDSKEQPLDGDSAAKKKKQRKKKKKGNAKEDLCEAIDPLLDASDEARGTAELGWDESVEDTERLGPLPDWIDITEVCDLAVQGMQLGEMIESPSFRLFDAMSAIEIMDPKMDSGYKSTEDMTLERAVETGILTQSIPHEVLVGIMDQLLMYYLLWLEGHTIVQTCFCCLYLLDLEKHVRPMPLFGAFVDAFLAACRMARNAVLRAGVFDDEDFLPSMFGIDLEVSVFSSEPVEIGKRLQEERKELSKSSSPLANVLGWRLEFMGEYMLALAELGDGESKNSQRRKDSAQQRLTTSLRVLERLREHASAPLPTALQCFDPSINRKLLVPGPPRIVEPIEDPKAVLDMWTSHVHELLLCTSLTQRSLEQLLDGAVTYKDEPNVLARSIAQIGVSEEGLLRRLMLDSLTLCLFPREAVQHCKKAVDQFLFHSESLVSHLLKLAHTNCARRFRRLAHVFSDFNALQHEAWQLDEDLKQTFGANLRHPRPCWVWIMEQTLQAMIKKLFLGFELDLYDPTEFHMIYWYIDYLFGLRIYNLNELYHAKEQPVGGATKRPKQQKQNQPGLRGGLRPRNPPPFVLLLEATQSAVRGLFRLLAFCLRRGLLAGPALRPEPADSRSSAGLAQRFVLRFRSLEQFRLPHLPSFRDFEQSSQNTQAPMESRVVLDAAQASFTEAEQLLQKISAATSKDQTAARDPALEGTKTLRRVVVANQLAVTQLLRVIETGQITRKSSKVSATLAHHAHLVSVQVQAAD